MRSVIIADTSCLILLSKIDELPLLQSVFGAVYVTQEIAAEFGKALPDWVEVVPVKDRKYLELIQASLDVGEASAIALAMELDDCLLILDDNKGRRFARQLGIQLTGTIGLIVAAKNLGLISRLKPCFDKIQKTDFRISEEIIKHILSQHNEL
jgi:predicted nucleic acid-binding protein